MLRSTASDCELVQALRLLVVPAHDRVRLLVGLGGLGHQRAHLLRLRCEILAPHQLADDEAQRHAVLGLSREEVGRELDVLGLHALLLKVPRHPLHHLLRLGVEQRLRERELRLRAQRAEDLLLDQVLELSLELELQVRLDLGAQVVEAAARDPEGLRERVVERGQHRRVHLLHVQRELGVLAGHLLAVIVGRERQRKRLLLSRHGSQHRRLELREHAAFAKLDREILRLPARELDAIDATGEVDDDPVALALPAARPATRLHAACGAPRACDPRRPASLPRPDARSGPPKDRRSRLPDTPRRRPRTPARPAPARPVPAASCATRGSMRG